MVLLSFSGARYNSIDVTRISDSVVMNLSSMQSNRHSYVTIFSSCLKSEVTVSDDASMSTLPELLSNITLPRP